MLAHIDIYGNLIFEGVGRLDRPLKILINVGDVDRLISVRDVKFVESRTEKRYLGNSRSISRFMSERRADEDHRRSKETQRYRPQGQRHLGQDPQ